MTYKTLGQDDDNLKITITDADSPSVLVDDENLKITITEGAAMTVLSLSPVTVDGAPVTSVNGETGAVVLDTDDVEEGTTNLYYTDARADARAQLKIDALVDGAPGALDTLNEIAAALNDDADVYNTLNDLISTNATNIALKFNTADFNSTFDSRLATKDTDDVAEGGNLYYTQARFDTAFGAKGAADVSYDPTDAPNMDSTNVKAALDHLDLNKVETTAMGTSVVQYYTDASTGITGYTLSVDSLLDAEFDTTAVDIDTGTFSADDTELFVVASEVGTIIGNPGHVTAHAIVNARRTSGFFTSSAFYFKVFHRNSGGTETLMGTSGNTLPLTNTDYTELVDDALLSTPVEFTATDRIVIKWYSTDVTGTARYDFQFGGSSPSRTNFPVPVNLVVQDQDASEVETSTTNFDGLLSSSDTTVQAALDTLDDIDTDDVSEGTTNLYFTDAKAISAVEGEATLDLSGDVTIADNKSLTFNNAHPSNRHTIIESKTGGQGGLVLTEENALTDNRRLDIIFRQTNSAGDTTHPIGSFDAVYDTTEADKRFQIRVMNNDGTAQANPHLEVRHTGDTVLRNNDIHLKEIDNTDMLSIQTDSGAVGGHDAQLFGQLTIQPELTTESDLDVFQIKPDYGSNSIPDGADVKLNFQIRNDTLGSVSLGRFSAVYDADDADKKFRMSSPDGSNAMEFFNSKTRLDSTVELDTSDADKIRSVSGDLTLVNTSNGDDIVFKIDDTGGTTQTGATIGTDDYTKIDDTTGYKSYIQNNSAGIKIGSGEFSSTGNTPDNGAGDYELNGINIVPTGNSWPSLSLFSTGESTGKNPLYDQTGLSQFQQYPNAVVTFGAANGTVDSESALESGKRVGQLAFMVHDGTRYGGSSSRASADITCETVETAASDNDRACQITMSLMPEGGDGTTSQRTQVLKLLENEVLISPEGNDYIKCRPNQYGNATEIFSDLIVEEDSGYVQIKTDSFLDGNLDIRPAGGGSNRVAKFEENRITFKQNQNDHMIIEDNRIELRPDDEDTIILENGRIEMFGQTTIDSDDGLEVRNADGEVMFSSKNNDPAQFSTKETTRSVEVVHTLDTDDQSHTMMKFTTDLTDQTPYSHTMGFTGETQGDDIDQNADEGFCGRFDFRWSTDGNHSVEFRPDNYQNDVFSTRTAIKATTSIVQFETMLRMMPIITDITANRPASPSAGDLFFNKTTKNLQMYTDAWQDITNSKGMMFTSTDNNLYFYDGSDWRPVSLGTAL